jgi:hypothetical protein
MPEHLQDLQALPVWQRLAEHAEQVRGSSLRAAFADDPGAPRR